LCADFAGSIRIPQTGSISVEDGAGWRTIAEPYAETLKRVPGRGI
jgi:hypothetical protein